MPPKSSEISFNELGQVVMPVGAFAPSEATLLARAHLLQGQESRRDADELLTSSIATPEELKAFVGGRSDLTPGDILGAKVAQASAAQLREGVTAASDKARSEATAASGKQLAATKKTSAAVNSLRQESAAAARLADITARALAAAQLTATTDSSEQVRQAVATADSAARSAAADAADAAARLEVAIGNSAVASATAITPAVSSVPASGTPAGASSGIPPRSGRQPRPAYVDKIVASLSARAIHGHTDAQSGIDALERLVRSGFFVSVVNPGSGGLSRNVTEDEVLDLQVLKQAGAPVHGGKVLQQYLDASTTEAGKKRLMGSSFPRPRPAGTPLSAGALLSSPPLPTTLVGLPPAMAPTPAPAPAPQTGSGLEVNSFAWKSIASAAMDLAEAGKKLEALRLVAQHAAGMPESKLAQIHEFIVRQ